MQNASVSLLRHNEIKYCIGDIASQVWTQDVISSDSGLQLDLGVCGA